MTDDCLKIERFQEEEETIKTTTTTNIPSTSSSRNMTQSPLEYISSTPFPINNKKQLLETFEEEEETEDSFHLIIPSNKSKVTFSNNNQQQHQQSNSTNNTTGGMDNFLLSTTSTTTTIILDSNSTSSCGESTSVKSFHDEMEDDDESMIKIPTSARLKQNFLHDEDEDETLDEIQDECMDDDDNLGLSIKSNTSLLTASSSSVNPHIPKTTNNQIYSKPKVFLLDSPQVQSPLFQNNTTPKLNLQNNKHLRNMSDISVYSNMYDDELDPSLISKYFNNNDDDNDIGDNDELEDDFEYNERLYSNSRNGVGSNSSLFINGNDDDDDELLMISSNELPSLKKTHGLNQDLSDNDEDDDDEFSSIFVKINTNIKRQVNKIGGEETRPEAIPTVFNNEDDSDLSIIFGKKMKIPRRSSQSGKSNVGILKFYASKEGRNRSISDVSNTFAQIQNSRLTRSAITPNDEMVDEILLNSTRNSDILSDKHIRMRAESIKLIESLGIDNTFDTPTRIPAGEITLERQRIAFLAMYSSRHRAKFQEESSLVIQSLFRGYVERKKSTKGLVFMSYICTAAFGKVNRMRRERDMNGIEIIRAALQGSQSRKQYHIEKTIQNIPTISSESNVNNNQESDNVNNISLTNSIHCCCVGSSSSSSGSSSGSGNSISDSPKSVDLAPPLLLISHQINEEQLVNLQALCRGRIYKLNHQVRNFKINKRIHLLTKSHPLIRDTYKCFMDIIVGKWNISSKDHLTFLDQKTTNIIASTHKLYPLLVENLYQLVSCNTKNKYWVMRRSLYDLMSESNNTEFEEILEVFNQFSTSLLKSKTFNETDIETAQMKLFIEFLLDQGNILPKILMQLMFPEQIYRNSTDFFQSPFISNRNSKRTLIMLHSVNSFSTIAKQSYSEKSPMSSDAFASDFAFLCEELSKVFFESNFKSILFEKRLFQFHSTVCHLLDLLTSNRGKLSEKENMEIYKIVLQKLLPYLYSLISLDLAKFDSQSNKTLWDYIQSTLNNSNLESVISLTNSMKFITIALPTTTTNHEGHSLKRRKSFSRSLSRSQKTLKLEMSKEKFNLFASFGLANNLLDQYISQLFQSFSREKILKSDSPLCTLNIQSSVVSALRSLQSNGNFATLITTTNE